MQVYYQRLYQRQLEIGVVTLMAEGSHAEVTHVYVVNSPVGAWNFQRNNACLGVMQRQCRFITNACTNSSYKSAVEKACRYKI